VLEMATEGKAAGWEGEGGRASIGSSAFIEAAYNGYTEMVRALLAVPGIDVNLRTLCAAHGTLTYIR
jgi:hypothetical protein